VCVTYDIGVYIIIIYKYLYLCVCALYSLCSRKLSTANNTDTYYTTQYLYRYKFEGIIIIMILCRPRTTINYYNILLTLCVYRDAGVRSAVYEIRPPTNAKHTLRDLPPIHNTRTRLFAIYDIIILL